MNNKRQFIYKGYTVFTDGFKYTIPELNNYHLSTMQDVEEYIYIKNKEVK